MKYYGIVLLLSCLVLPACAGGKAAAPVSSGAPTDYVEVPNPTVTMSKDAPATIWVPRSDVEKGVQRGGVYLEQGVDAAKEGLIGRKTVGVSAPVDVVPVSSPAAPTVAASPAVTGTSAVTRPAATVKKRLAILETGQNGLLTLFREQVRAKGIGVPVDPSVLGGVSAVSDDDKERTSLAARFWGDNMAACLVIVSAPEGVGPGKMLIADSYDGLEQARLRRVSITVPTSGDANGNLSIALADLALRMSDVIGLTPWYGRVIAVEGGRAYFNAGRESGVTLGQSMKIYRGGKMVPGVGFDPGTAVGVIEIGGFIGPNGSYGAIKDGQSVQLTDVVAVE